MPLIQQEKIDVQLAMPAIKTLLQVGARMYMHFTRETLATFGRAGEMTVRKHLRDYGKWRGTEMREAHNAMGREINMETLNRCWDSASVFIVKDDLENNGKYTPTDVIYDVRVCPAAEAWKADEFHQWGHVYCDEFHQACASTYHPDGNVVIPINMMKGDDHCHFRWMLPIGAHEVDYSPPSMLGKKLAQNYVAETPERASYDALIRTSRLIGGRYWTMTEALFADYPADEAEACIRRFLRSWATQRGELLRRDHEAKGVPLTAANLVREIDMASKYVWEMSEETTAHDRYIATVDWTPMDDAWSDLNASPVAELFWEESLPEVARAYNPRLSLEVAELRWSGGDRMRFVITESDQDGSHVPADQ